MLRILSSTLLPLWGLTMSLPAQGTLHRDVRHGFELRLPKGFTLLPMRPGEGWRPIVSISDKVHSMPGKKTNTMRSTFQIIVFSDPAKNLEPDAPRRHVYNPHQTHDGYLKSAWSRESFEIVSDEKLERHSLAVRELELKTHLKKIPYRRILSAAYSLPGVQVVAEVDVPYDAKDALKATLWKSIRSLRATKTCTPDEGAHREPAYPVFGNSKAELRAQFLAQYGDLAGRDLSFIEGSTPSTWSVRRDTTWLILSQGGAKASSLTLRSADGIRDWLVEMCGTPAGKTRNVLRIFEHQAEASAYAFSGTPSYLWASGELVCLASTGTTAKRFGNWAVMVALQYFSSRNMALWSAMPGWLSAGIETSLDSSQPSRRQGLVVPRPKKQYRQLRRRIEAGTLIPLADFLARPRAEVMREFQCSEREYWAQGVLFGKFLVDLPRTRRKFVHTYLDALTEELDGWVASEWKDKLETQRQAKTPFVRHAQDRFLRHLRAFCRKFRVQRPNEWRTLNVKAAEVTFGKWSTRQWDRLQKQFDTYLRNGMSL